ncbi:MAG: V-type ATP synthase subunit K [Candidatus Hydrogenedentes bacterium]|nr:V-type ATP synthase subunit K [Candidatus Hydrogenedentota bacterium]
MNQPTEFIGLLAYGIVLGLGAIGTALGTAAAAQSAAGCWEKEGRLDRPLKFTYLIFVSAPLTQTLYAFIIMNALMSAGKLAELNGMQAFVMLGIAIGGGLAEWFSAWGQGKVGAAACRALCNNDGKGFAFMIIAIGVVETVGLFAMVFLRLVVTNIVVAAPA